LLFSKAEKSSFLAEPFVFLFSKAEKSIVFYC
jgi:hypothetical protein